MKKCTIIHYLHSKAFFSEEVQSPLQSPYPFGEEHSSHPSPHLTTLGAFCASILAHSALGASPIHVTFWLHYGSYVS